MKRIIFTAILLFSVLILASCNSRNNIKDFNFGLSEFNKTMQAYNSTLEKLPSSTKELGAIKTEVSSISTALDQDSEAFKYLIDYATLVIESEEFKIRGESYGEFGKASDGFGCKQRPLIYESANFRNQSAQKGFESLKLLEIFIEKFPNEAKSAGLWNKTIIFKNGDYVKMEKEAKSDKAIVNNLCPVNRTLEIYRDNFKKTLNMTKEEVDKLTYEQAVEIYKQNRYDKIEVFK